MTRGPRPGRFLALLSIAVALALSFHASAASIGASAPSEVTPRDAVGQDSNPRMAEHGGKMHLFWSGNARDGSDFDIVHMAYDGVWSAPEVVTASDGAANDHTPFPVSFDGELWLFWSTDNPSVTGGSGSDIACSKLTSAGWSPFQSLTAAYNPSGDYDPKAVVFESRLCVFFESFDSAAGVYEIAWTTNSGSGWGAPSALVEGAGTSFNPAPAAAPGGLLLAW